MQITFVPGTFVVPHDRLDHSNVTDISRAPINEILKKVKILYNFFYHSLEEYETAFEISDKDNTS